MQHQPWMEPILFALRTLGVGIIIYLMSRYLPRRAGSGLAAYDFVFFWMMGGLAVAPLYFLKIKFTDTITAVITIYLCHYALSGLALVNRRWAGWLSGTAIPVIERGSIRKERMERALLPIEILLSELRHAGAARVSAVETALLETSGQVSVVKKADHLPVTAGDLQKHGTDQPLPVVVVADGKVLRRNLDKLGVDEGWLKEKLQKAGASELAGIYAAVWEGSDPIYWTPRSFP